MKEYEIQLFTYKSYIRGGGVGYIKSEYIACMKVSNDKKNYIKKSGTGKIPKLVNSCIIWGYILGTMEDVSSYDRKHKAHKAQDIYSFSDPL